MIEAKLSPVPSSSSNLDYGVRILPASISSKGLSGSWSEL